MAEAEEDGGVTLSMSQSVPGSLPPPSPNTAAAAAAAITKSQSALLGKSGVLGLVDEHRFDLGDDVELPDATPSAANYKLPGCLETPGP